MANLGDKAMRAVGLGGPYAPPEQMQESVETIVRVIATISEGLESICGLENQVAFQSKVIELLEEEMTELTQIDPENIPYTAEELYSIERSLTNLSDIVVRLHPAAHDDFGVVLKEVRTLLSLGYERNNLLSVMNELTKTLSEIPAFEIKNGNKLQEGGFLDPKLVKVHMKKDESSLIPLLHEKCDILAARETDLGNEASNMFRYLETGAKIMSVFDALDVQEVTEFDKFIRRRILEDECHIDKTQIDFDDASLGEGVFGIVDSGSLYYGKKHKKKAKVAIKTLKIEEEVLKDEYVEMTNEVALWRTIDCPFIVKCFGMSLRKFYVHLVMERMGVSLYDHLYINARKPTKKELEKLARDVGLGLYQLHSLNITHRNMSSKNVMLTSERLGGVIKLTDFGVGLYKYRNQTKGPTAYTPPEVLGNDSLNYNHHGWTTKGDMYAFGMLLWEASQEKKEEPFEDKIYELHDWVGKEKNSVDVKKGNADKWLKQIIKNLLSVDPAYRPNAKDVCEKVFDNGHRNIREGMREEISKIKLSASDFGGYAASPSARNKESGAEDEEVDVQVPPAREPIPSMRSPKTREPAPPGTPPKGLKKARPPPHRRLPTQDYDEEEEEEEDEESEEGDVYDNPDFYAQRRGEKNENKGRGEEYESQGSDFDDTLSEASRGPNIVEENKARRVGGLVNLAIDSCSNKKKLSGRIKNLKEDVLSNDRYEFTTQFARLMLKKKLRDVDCEVLGLLIRWNTRLVRVILEFNKFTNLGIEYLATGVAHHPTLLQLYIGRNKKVSNVEKLLKKIHKNRVLEVLSLDGCTLDTQAAKQIGQFLSKNKYLLQLDISENKIDSEGMGYIAEGMKTNEGIEGLIVHDQKVSCGKGMKKLKKVMKKKKLRLNKRVID